MGKRIVTQHISGDYVWYPVTTPQSELLKTRPYLASYCSVTYSVRTWASVFASFCHFMMVRDSYMFKLMLSTVKFDFMYKQNAEHDYAGDKQTRYRHLVDDWYFRLQGVTDAEFIKQTLQLTEMFDMLMGTELVNTCKVQVIYK